MERKEPQNIEAEINLLGCVILSNEVLSRVIDEIEPNMFYLDSHKKIYEAIKKLYSQDIGIDVTTLSNELEKKKQLDSVGGIEYITEIIDSVVSYANVDHYVNIVYEKYILRNLISKTNKIIDACYEEKDNISEILDKVEKSLSSTDFDRTIKDVKIIKDILNETVEQRRPHNNNEITGVASGYYDLDKRTTGFNKNELIILAARPGMGKSSLSNNIAINVVTKSQKSVVFFSLEMSSEEVINRMLSSLGQIELRKIRTGNLTPSEVSKLEEIEKLLMDAKLFIDDTAGITVAEIRRKCKKLKNTNDLDLVIIDYLQLITSSSKYAGNKVNEVTEISRELKKLAMELEVPVIALSQLSRSVEYRDDKRPQLADLRDSGSIEQDADIVLFIYIDDYYNYEFEERPVNSVSEIIISKNRNGGTGKIELLFEREFTCFKNYQKD